LPLTLQTALVSANDKWKCAALVHFTKQISALNRLLHPEKRLIGEMLLDVWLSRIKPGVSNIT